MFLSLTQGHQHGISIPSASSADTGLNSDQLLAKALFPAWVWVYTVGVTFCVKIKHVGKCICPVWLHEWEDWIHALSKPLVMGGGGGGFGLHPFFFMVHLFEPPFRPCHPIFSLILVSSYHLVACGLTGPVTHLSSPQDFVKQVSTGSRLLCKADLGKKFLWLS